LAEIQVSGGRQTVIQKYWVSQKGLEGKGAGMTGEGAGSAISGGGLRGDIGAETRSKCGAGQGKRSSRKDPVELICVQERWPGQV
jgi:hypothetical protein